MPYKNRVPTWNPYGRRGKYRPWRRLSMAFDLIYFDLLTIPPFFSRSLF
jgi:hypothetical protein